MLRPRSCFALLLAALAALGAETTARAEEPPPLPPPEAPLPALPPPSAPSRPPASGPSPAPPPAPPPASLPPWSPPSPVHPPPSAPAPPGPSELAPWDPDRPLPDGYVLRSRPQTGLIFAGATMVSVTWVTSIAVGLIAAEDETERGIDGDGVEADDWTPLYVPVAGPFATVVSVDSEGAGTALLVVDGALQAAGVALIVVGSLVQSHRAVRVSHEVSRVTVAPTVSRETRGVVVGGVF